MSSWSPTAGKRFKFLQRIVRTDQPQPETGPSTASRTSSTAAEPSMILHIPARGKVFVHTPRDPVSVQEDPPAVIDQIVGQVEVRLPRGSGRRKCKGIRLVWRTWCSFDVQDGNGQRDYMIDEEVIEHLGERIINEGSWR